ncbi:MAG TPA: energy transducer TonB [Thermoanaerobaculia bacterium]|nr:energy transducer TonB [Thermoanaerobaculia bacterium]
MHDRVADVLAQRAALDRGAGVGIAISVLLHGGLAAFAVYAALHATPPQHATMVNIQFASVKPISGLKPAAPPVAPKLEEVKPKIEEPKPAPKPEEPKKPEKNTVPLSPFGRSTKKGSETPAPTPPTPAPQPLPAATDTGPTVGTSGVTGLEGGDFPYSLYLTGMIRKIGGNWFRPQVSAGVEVIIYFRILRNGTIVESRVEKSSGNPTFDRAALSAVRSSSPLTPLPFGFNGNYLGVHQTFR